MKIEDRFIRYAKIGTMSDETSNSCPSTKKQMKLLSLLCAECIKEGLADVSLTSDGYLYARLPSNTDTALPKIGLIAHVDTSPDMSDKNINPRVIRGYDGNDIVLNGEKKIIMKVCDFPVLPSYAGDDLIVTDGTTLLGADDKAGIAEIMDSVIRLSASGMKHGDVMIAFTPDEEIGRGADRFNIESFGADFAYTVDGGSLGEIEYENFNAATAKITVDGASIHPGTAKDRMINAASVACEIESILPESQRPEHTEGYEGFFHLSSIEGCVESARMTYIIRDHDRAKFEAKKKLMSDACAYINERLGREAAHCEITDTYYNMREKIEPHREIVERLVDAMNDADVTPRIVPIRGGTDGARLSYMGLLCPNICTGGENFHGKYEFISIQKMKKVSDVLFCLLTKPGLSS